MSEQKDTPQLATMTREDREAAAFVLCDEPVLPLFRKVWAESGGEVTSGFTSECRRMARTAQAIAEACGAARVNALKPDDAAPALSPEQRAERAWVNLYSEGCASGEWPFRALDMESAWKAGFIAALKEKL